MIRCSAIIHSLAYLNSRLGFSRLKYLYSVISVIVDLLPADTKRMAIDMFVDGQSAISRILGGLLKTQSQKLCVLRISDFWEFLWYIYDKDVCTEHAKHVCCMRHRNPQKSEILKTQNFCNWVYIRLVEQGMRNWGLQEFLVKFLMLQNLYIHTYINIYIHTHIHIYIYIYVYMYVYI